MKKILVINNDYHLPEHVVDVALQIAKEAQATVFGLFVQSLKKEDEESYIFPSDINLTDVAYTKETVEEENLELENANIKIFKDACDLANIPCKIHSVHENFLDALIDHSAFADIIICDAESAPAHYSFNTFLAQSHCPVLLVTREFTKVHNIIFTYDDKPSSIHAIKLFTYLFKFYRDHPVHLVSVVPVYETDIEYADLIKEWIPLHYPNAKMIILKGVAKEEIPRYINGLSNPLVIMGSFGRSSLSRFFKESLANLVLAKTNAPIFIAHD